MQCNTFTNIWGHLTQLPNTVSHPGVDPLWATALVYSRVVSPVFTPFPCDSVRWPWQLSCSGCEVKPVFMICLIPEWDMDLMQRVRLQNMQRRNWIGLLCAASRQELNRSVWPTRPNAHSCVCVCACVRERERERIEAQLNKQTCQDQVICVTSVQVATESQTFLLLLSCPFLWF